MPCAKRTALVRRAGRTGARCRNNWRNAKQNLNQLAHYGTEIDDLGIHFVWERGKGPAPFPLILTHGYPDSFYRYVKLIPLLTDPAAFGGHAEDAFDVVVSNIPDYGFSDKPDKKRIDIFRERSLGASYDGATGLQTFWRAWRRLG